MIPPLAYVRGRNHSDVEAEGKGWHISELWMLHYPGRVA